MKNQTFENKIAMRIVNGEVEYETVKLEVYPTKLVWQVGEQIVETLRGQIPRLLLNKTLDKDILDFHKETILQTLVVGREYNIVFYPAGHLVAELRKRTYTNKQDATPLSRELYFFSLDNKTCGAVTADEFYRIQWIGHLTYFAIFDKQIGDFMATGHNSNTKEELAADMVEYLKNGMETKDLKKLLEMSAEDVINHFESLGFAVEQRNTPFQDLDDNWE